MPGIPLFDEGSGSLPHPEDGGLIGDTTGLGEVVGDDDDGDLPPQGVDEILDNSRGDGIESAARFVEENHFGLEGEGPGDAEALLLTARETDGTLVETVTDFVPEADFAEDFFHAVGDVLFTPAMFLERDLEVSLDGLGEGIGPLENDAYAPPQCEHVGFRIGDRGAVGEVYAAGDLAAGDEIGEAVEAQEETAFPAAGRTDDGGDFSGGDVEGDVPHREVVAVGDGKTGDTEGG